MVNLQLLTGARPGEIVILRGCDIDQSDPSGVWQYRPTIHKGLVWGKDRHIFIGPRAQRILVPLLEGRDPTAYVFSPAEADQARRAALHAKRQTPMSCGNKPGSNRKASPSKKPGGHYTTVTYNRAVHYACEQAFRLPADLAPRSGESLDRWRARLTPTERAAVREWRQTHSWHVHQLRHNAGSEIRRAFGLEAAQLALGHASAQITDAVYAEWDWCRVVAVMQAIG
jgi:integrase